MRTLILPILLIAATPALAAPVPPVVAQAVADASRPADQRATDAIRKPAETLAFSGVRPGMAVGEFYPGSGYYTHMLARIVGPNGHVDAIENARWSDAQQVAALSKIPYTNFAAVPFGTVKFSRPLDLAWITQNYHDLKVAKYGVVDTAAFDRQVFAALKPGGVFMIIDHEAPKGTDVAGIEKLHRIERTQVFREVTAAGFKLVGEGDFLRQPADDHSLSIFDKAIQGKTDQYALKFMKPVR